MMRLRLTTRTGGLFRRPRARGQALVEFALMGLILGMLLAAAVDFGRAYYTALIVEDMAGEGAHYAAKFPANDLVDPSCLTNGLVANQNIQALSTLDVAGRVARQILVFADQYGRHDANGIRIPVPLTQSDIAEMVGATRERVNHAMVAFKQQGTVSVDAQHRITIHDRRALAERCR